MVCLSNTSKAQNLVPNPDFELMNDCDFAGYPIMGGIADWFSFNYQKNTVDVLNTCLPYPELQPPNTIRGYGYPHSGNSMVGIVYVQEVNYREVVSVALTNELLKDSAYCVSFWVKNSRIENMYYWVEQIGLLFTNAIIDSTVIVQSSPDIRSGTDLGNPEWLEVSGYYIAQGGERYANIGFFGPSIQKYQSLPFDPVGSTSPYYFIDDVSVIPCNKDSLLSVICEFPNVFTPGGTEVNNVYALRLNNIRSLDIQVLNRWGNLVKQYDGTKMVWEGTDENGTPLSAGVYYIKAVGETTFGDILERYQFVHLIR
jgi:gliding motility-associated-like protein